ncbi:MAG: putative ABC transporter permease subunit [Fimbriiglobus sp.]
MNTVAEGTSLVSLPSLEATAGPAKERERAWAREDQAAVFRRVRTRMAINAMQSAWSTGKVKVLTMILTSLFVAAFVFGLSWYGIREMFQLNVPAKGMIVGGLFDLMFFTLGGMLIFSTGIILYASLFTAPEARFLLTSPAKADRIFAVKFQGAVMFSSWAFLILGVPILVSYGLVAGVPWYFYPLLPLYLLGFVLLPGSVSAMICLLLVRFAPRNRRQFLIILTTLILIPLTYWGVKTAMAVRSSVIATKKNEVEGLLSQFALVQHPLTPSHWMTNGLMAAARGEVQEALVPLGMIWTNGLMLYLGAAWIAARTYRTAYDRTAGGGRAKQVYQSHFLDRLMGWSVFYLDPPTRILVVKDFRTFRRDPTQWVLLAIFAGMLLLGASNYRAIIKNDLAVLDQYVVSLVNIAAMCILLCAGLSRFIFPLISLEGRKFWILGLMPIRRRQILMGKFYFSATLSLTFVETMTIGSDLLIGIPWPVLLSHALTVGVAAIGLSGLNVGLGAYLPNFRETDPSKIVVGFGGTLNMVISLMFIILVISLMAVPQHFAGVSQGFGQNAAVPWWAYLGIPLGVCLGVAAVILPLRAGTRSLENTEF